VVAAGAPPPGPWGFAVQLYSLRSARLLGATVTCEISADLAAWSARELGAGFVLINPLHAAASRLPPVSASPYLPMSRPLGVAALPCASRTSRNTGIWVIPNGSGLLSFPNRFARPSQNRRAD